MYLKVVLCESSFSFNASQIVLLKMIKNFYVMYLLNNKKERKEEKENKEENKREKYKDL